MTSIQSNFKYKKNSVKVTMDDERVQKLVRELIIELGEDPNREGLKDTPKLN